MSGAKFKNSSRLNCTFHEQGIASYSAAPEEMKTGAGTASRDLEDATTSGTPSPDIEHETPALAQAGTTRRYTARHNDLTLNDNPPNFVIE